MSASHHRRSILLAFAMLVTLAAPLAVATQQLTLQGSATSRATGTQPLDVTIDYVLTVPRGDCFSVPSTCVAKVVGGTFTIGSHVSTITGGTATAVVDQGARVSFRLQLSDGTAELRAAFGDNSPVINGTATVAGVSYRLLATSPG